MRYLQDPCTGARGISVELGHTQDSGPHGPAHSARGNPVLGGRDLLGKEGPIAFAGGKEGPIAFAGRSEADGISEGFSQTQEDVSSRWQNKWIPKYLLFETEKLKVKCGDFSHLLNIHTGGLRPDSPGTLLRGSLAKEEHCLVSGKHFPSRGRVSEPLCEQVETFRAVSKASNQ